MESHEITDLLNGSLRSNSQCSGAGETKATQRRHSEEVEELLQLARMQSELRDLEDIYNSKMKGSKLSADFIHESSLKHFMETVRAVPNNRNDDIYEKYVALRDHIRPLSNVAINSSSSLAIRLAS